MTIIGGLKHPHHQLFCDQSLAVPVSRLLGPPALWHQAGVLQQFGTTILETSSAALTGNVPFCQIAMVPSSPEKGTQSNGITDVLTTEEVFSSKLPRL